jgi:hypothetical protein
MTTPAARPSCRVGDAAGVRGLLCLTCNVALGYIETYSGLAMAYLETALRPASPNRPGVVGLRCYVAVKRATRLSAASISRSNARIHSFLSFSVNRRPTLS